MNHHKSHNEDPAVYVHCKFVQYSIRQGGDFEAFRGVSPYLNISTGKAEVVFIPVFVHIVDKMKVVLDDWTPIAEKR